MRTCRLELSLVRKPAWAERRCFLGLCSWFLHISPHLNAGISTASSLGEKKPKQQKTFNSEIWAYSGFLLRISWKPVFTENGESALKHLLKTLYASRILSEPSLLRHRQPACFFHGEGRELKEGTWAARCLSAVASLSTKSPNQWEQWPLKMWGEYEPSVWKLAKQKNRVWQEMGKRGSILPWFHNSSLRRLLNDSI